MLSRLFSYAVCFANESPPPLQRITFVGSEHVAHAQNNTLHMYKFFRQLHDRHSIKKIREKMLTISGEFIADILSTKKPVNGIYHLITGHNRKDEQHSFLRAWRFNPTKKKIDLMWTLKNPLSDGTCADNIHHMVLSPDEKQCIIATAHGCLFLRRNVFNGNFYLDRTNNSVFERGDTIGFVENQKFAYLPTASSTIYTLVHLTAQGQKCESEHYMNQFMNQFLPNDVVTIVYDYIDQADCCISKKETYPALEHNRSLTKNSPQGDMCVAFQKTLQYGTLQLYTPQLYSIAHNSQRRLEYRAAADGGYYRTAWGHHNDTIRAISSAFSFTGEYVAIGFANGETWVWNTEKADPLTMSPSENNQAVVALDFSPENLLVRCLKDGSLNIVSSHIHTISQQKS